MPSDRTGRRPARASTSDPASVRHHNALRQRWPALLAVTSLALILTGCNTGSMNEARNSQEFDKAAETPQLSAQQATRTAQTFFSPTATPAAPTVVPPKLETLVITLGVGPDGGPSGSYLSVPVDAGTAYAAGRLSDVRAGQVVSAIWTDAFGNHMGTFEVELAADAATQWVSVPLQLNGALAAGEYAVYLFGGGRQLGSLAFMVTGAGSGAQLLPDLPANPQARSTMAPPSSQQQQQGSGNNQQDSNGRQSGGEWQQPAEDTWQQPAEGTWQQDQWNQQPQDQWSQPSQDQWNQPHQDGQSSVWN